MFVVILDLVFQINQMTSMLFMNHYKTSLKVRFDNMQMIIFKRPIFSTKHESKTCYAASKTLTKTLQITTITKQSILLVKNFR